MDFGDFGIRAVVLLAMAAAGGYLAVTLFRLARVGRKQAQPVAHDLTFISSAGLIKPAEIATKSDADSFAGHLARSGLESEVKQLREELAILRDELAAMRTTRRVSPLYGEALALAQRGFDARGIADECGISVSEAELVLAMSRDGNVSDDGGGHGGN